MTEQTQNNDPKKTPLNLAAIRERLKAGNGRETWRSLGELAQSEEFQEFLEQEFPRQATIPQALSRRDFLKLLAGPLALAGLTACVPRPNEQILPYVQAPEGVTPGRPLFYATAMELDGYARGLLAESHMGRPTKVEGNPEHPASLGATDVFAQASVLSLYDPDRAQVITSRGNIRTWESFSGVFSQSLDVQRSRQGAGLRVLTGTVTSPTLAAQLRDLLEQFPQARWHQYDPVGRDNVRLGAEMAFGEMVETHYRFEQANVILSLGNNFILHEPGSLRYIREFTARRQVLDGQTEMNRLYVVESSLTAVGGFADHRLALPASQIEAFARLLARQVGVDVPPVAGDGPAPAGWIEALAEDLQANQGSGLILVGHQQPPAVHALAHAMNQALGNVGQTVIYTDPVEANPVDQTASLAELAQDLEAKQVDLLVVLDGNPVYTAPADLNFPGNYRRAGLSVYLGLYEDETASASDWHLPGTHYLEMWSDTRAFDGTVSIIQPLVEPLYGGRSPHDLLAVMLGQPGVDGLELLQGYWQRFAAEGLPASGAVAGATPTPEATPEAESTPPAGTPTPPAGEGEGDSPAATPAAVTPAAEEGGVFERFWRSALRAGMVPESALPERQVSLQAGFSGTLAPVSLAQQEGSQGMEIVFEPDPSLWDGRFANNAWLQELPKPVTKLTWDNAALLSMGTAERLGLNNNDLVELHYRGRSVNAPVWIAPGHPDNSVTVFLGHGRTSGGSALEGAGFNAYAIRTSDAPWFGDGLEIRKTGRQYLLVSSQEHFSMEGRHLARAEDVEEFRHNPEIFHEGDHAPPPGTTPPSLYPEYEYEGYAWGMAINLNTCIGCNACVVACQAENNVPVVGKDQVENGREMHWLRLDTYFQGEMENPDTYFQPMLCMHCERAPCEPVCPVAATVHSSEGLNEMVYNRCVGTRYCSNNCPYKVRRFNFLQYADNESVPLKMLHNPEVTVRTRGVMEKCTFCVQRINAARVDSKTEGRQIEDGEVLTACQQACPAQAIVFGDINDENSLVHRLKAQPQNYELLGELGTQPRTTYLGKLRNPNPRIRELS